MPRRLAERGIAAQQVGVAEHIGEARLHQGGAPLIRDRCAQRIEIFEKPAGRIVDARKPKAADMIDQPRPQRAQDRPDRKIMICVRLADRTSRSAR